MTTTGQPSTPAHAACRVYLYYRGQGYDPTDSRLFVAAYLNMIATGDGDPGGMR